jgi:hypothetical protein
MNDCEQEAGEPFVGSLAFFRRVVDDVEEWLTFWDDDRQHYRLIQSARGEGETYRSCLHNEIESVTGLSRDRDFIISGLSVAHHQSPIAWPDGSEPQWVIVQFFPVQLYGENARRTVDRLGSARWMTLSEIFAGRTTDGEPFDPRQHHLIERADIIPAHIKG